MGVEQFVSHDRTPLLSPSVAALLTVNCIRFIHDMFLGIRVAVGGVSPRPAI